jgi:hypothetical protein
MLARLERIPTHERGAATRPVGTDGPAAAWIGVAGLGPKPGARYRGTTAGVEMAGIAGDSVRTMARACCTRAHRCTQAHDRLSTRRWSPC